VLPDGRPLIWMARLTGGLRLSLVIGSDLVEPICAAAARVGYPIFLLDSRPEVLKTTAEILLRRHSGLRIAGFYAPPMGFDTSEEERRKALEAVRTARTDIVFVALGAPKRASGGPNPARAARTPGSDA
jgi:N-acetylglucosaminyldiphosphoundecaprenol N-acetyl-beta-D-mannosaminyltransferase